MGHTFVFNNDDDINRNLKLEINDLSTSKLFNVPRKYSD